MSNPIDNSPPCYNTTPLKNKLYVPFTFEKIMHFQKLIWIQVIVMKRTTRQSNQCQTLEVKLKNLAYHRHQFSETCFVLDIENLCIQTTTNNQQPKYRVFQILFVELGGQGKSGVWQQVHPSFTNILDVGTLNIFRVIIKVFVPVMLS